MNKQINDFTDDTSPQDTDSYVFQEAGLTTKRITFSSIKTTLKTYFDSIYAKYLGDADFYKYSIVRTVDGSGNLTVAIKNYEGNDPTPTKPVKIQIGGVIRTLSSALSLTMNAGTNYFNLGSAELATKECDIFWYALWDGSSVGLAISRFPSANLLGDLDLGGGNPAIKEKGFTAVYPNGYNALYQMQNIGRFNATLSAGAGYTWSIPATSIIINNPIYDTRWLEIVPTWTGFSAIPTNVFSRYRLQGDNCFYRPHAQTNGTSNATTLTITAPFGASDLGFAHWTGSFLAVDSGATQAIPGMLYFATANAYIEVYKTWAFGAWTNSGGKRIADGMIIYKI